MHNSDIFGQWAILYTAEGIVADYEKIQTLLVGD
jgi:hypothetical protein